jgi:hypothetical protein
MLVCEPVVVLIAEGCVMVTETVVVLELASVMVTVYDPADRPVAEAEVLPEGDQE